jgi:hypothetical protein
MASNTLLCCVFVLSFFVYVGSFSVSLDCPFLSAPSIFVYFRSGKQNELVPLITVFSGVRVARSFVFCVMFCRSLFDLFRLAIVLSVLRCMASDYLLVSSNSFSIFSYVTTFEDHQHMECAFLC